MKFFLILKTNQSRYFPLTPQGEWTSDSQETVPLSLQESHDMIEQGIEFLDRVIGEKVVRVILVPNPDNSWGGKYLLRRI